MEWNRQRKRFMGRCWREHEKNGVETKKKGCCGVKADENKRQMGKKTKHN